MLFRSTRGFFFQVAGFRLHGRGTLLDLLTSFDDLNAHANGGFPVHDKVASGGKGNIYSVRLPSPEIGVLRRRWSKVSADGFRLHGPLHLGLEDG